MENLYKKTENFTDGTSLLLMRSISKRIYFLSAKKIVSGYQPVMPSYQGLLVDKEIEAIIEYIKELSK